MDEKDYNEYSLLWSCHDFFAKACMLEPESWELKEFIKAYGLDSKEAKEVRKKEGVK